MTVHHVLHEHRTTCPPQPIQAASAILVAYGSWASGSLYHWCPSRRILKPHSSSDRHATRQCTLVQILLFHIRGTLPCRHIRAWLVPPCDTWGPQDVLFLPALEAPIGWEPVHRACRHGRHGRADTAPCR